MIDETDPVREIFEKATIDKAITGHYPAPYSRILKAIIQMRGGDTRTVSAWLWRIATHDNVEVTPEVNLLHYGRKMPKFKIAVWDDIGEWEENTIEDDLGAPTEEEMDLLDAIPSKDKMKAHGSMAAPSENGRG